MLEDDHHPAGPAPEQHHVDATLVLWVVLEYGHDLHVDPLAEKGIPDLHGKLICGAHFASVDHKRVFQYSLFVGIHVGRRSFRNRSHGLLAEGLREFARQSDEMLFSM